MIQKAKINGVNVAYVIANPSIDKIFVDQQSGRSVKEIGQLNDTTIAVNFNFADTTNGIPIGRVIVDGTEIIHDITKTAPRDELYMLPNGSWHIGKAPAHAVYAAQSSPRILMHGKSYTKESIKRDQLDSSVWSGKAYRLSGGITSDGQLVICRTLDKVDMDKLEDIMLTLGCQDAINADGGGSAYLWPFDSGWGRKMGLAVCIKEGVRTMGDLNIKQDFIPVGRGNRPGHPMIPEYVTVHDTANADVGADAEAHANYLKGDTAASRPASWHYTVDDDSVIQHLPENENGWHAGDSTNGTGNRKSIGVEICENSDGNRDQAEINAEKLIAQLLDRHNLPVTAVVQHNKWSGKDCPHIFRHRNGGWSDFIAAIQVELNVLNVLPEEQKPVEEIDGFMDIAGHWALSSMQKAIGAGIINGVSTGVFAPDEPMTRAQWCVLMDRLGLIPEKEVK